MIQEELIVNVSNKPATTFQTDVSELPALQHFGLSEG